MTVTERVAYLKGIIEASELNENTKEARIIKVISDVLEDLALSVSDLEDGYSELSEQIDAIDEDLDVLEQEYYGLEEDEEEDTEFYEVECPSCGETLCLDEETLLSEKVTCPNCGQELEIDVHYGDGCDCETCDHSSEDTEE